jgi:hypothetical protein
VTLWTTGTATGIGSLPGNDPVEASRFVLGELPIPHLPELPGRGWHADIAGRGAAMLADLHVDLQPTGWRIVPRSSRDGRRCRDLLARDIDALEQAGLGSPPAVVKLQATGIWTLCSLLELHRGNKVLSDHSAVRDLTDSLAEGIALHVADVQRRFPNAVIAVQLDEPSLPAVLNGWIPTASGFGTFRSPSPQLARERLGTVLAAAENTVIHCCAGDPPLGLMAEAGAISIDASLPIDTDVLGELLERGTGLLLGVVPTSGPIPSVGDIVKQVHQLKDRSGLDEVTLTPACGLAGSSDAHARLGRCVEAAKALEEDR